MYQPQPDPADMPRPLLVLAALLLLAIPARVRAQGAVNAEGMTAGEVNARRNILNSMRVDLLRLVTAQENHFGDHERYTADLGALTRYKVPPAVTIAIGKVSAKGWLARATHADLRGLSCVIYVGEVEGGAPATAREGKKPDEEGRPVCDILP